MREPEFPVGRFNLSALAIKHSALTLYAMLALAATGIWAYATIGRAEDPPFTVKQMLVFLSWPGASAEDMQRAVTDRVERFVPPVIFGGGALYLSDDRLASSFGL